MAVSQRRLQRRDARADGGEVKEQLFNELIKEAASCTLCPAMCGRSAVLSELNGSPDAQIMFIGEAPGRKGADRTRVPFSGDQSGANLDRFLNSINLTRKEIFITSAAPVSYTHLRAHETPE